MHYTFFTTKPDSPARAVVEEFQNRAKAAGTAAFEIIKAAFKPEFGVGVISDDIKIHGFAVSSWEKRKEFLASLDKTIWKIRNVNGHDCAVPLASSPFNAAFKAIPDKMGNEEFCQRLFGVSRFFVGRETCCCSLEYSKDNSQHSIGVPWISIARKSDGLSKTNKVKLTKGLVKLAYDTAMRIHYTSDE